jgi:hydroxyethylthiazole kinase-like sugar kinase family protein
MALINKTGITDSGVIQAEHVTRAIDALSGGSLDTIIATGSFSGSVIGSLTGTASFASNALNAVSAVTASFASTAVTASFALSGAGIFPFTGSAVITG